MRLVQVVRGAERRVAVVEEPKLVLLGEVRSTLELAERALAEGPQALGVLANALRTTEALEYDAVYAGDAEWRLLPPIDAPDAPQRVLVSGTGLTHLGSARERQAMHAEAADAIEAAAMTDSMRMFAWGQERGRPAEGEIGVAPEWFYKGDGSVVQAPFAPLVIPGHAEDGGEEAEIAAVYVIGGDGTPYRIGMAQGNEFSDHVFERRNYLNLAGSKLRMCSLGPELVVDAAFADVAGVVRIVREGAVLWERRVRTGEANMAHSLANLEHHHFKFAGHCQPGMVHVHFLGADALSFGDTVRLEAGDVAELRFEGFGRALVNPVLVEETWIRPVRVTVMR